MQIQVAPGRAHSGPFVSGVENLCSGTNGLV